jgi:hypothetical protein
MPARSSASPISSRKKRSSSTTSTRVACFDIGTPIGTPAYKM